MLVLNNIYSFKCIPLQNNTFSRLYLRQNLIVLDEVTSTNDYLKVLLSNIKPLPEATAIMANHQSQGKGQRGSSFLDSPGETLMISFVLYPIDLSLSQSFNLNMLVCLGIQQWASEWLPDIQIKWPNDIYVNNRKLGGILIENRLSGNRIRSSIIGIGINIKQQTFPADLQDKATSFCIEKPTIQPQSLQQYGLSLLYAILTLYGTIGLQDTARLMNAYNNGLFRKGVSAQYEVQGTTYSGIIQGVNRDGKLNVFINGQERLFDLKEIRFVL